MNQPPSANGNQTFVVNHDIEQLPELINERQIEDIRHVLETPLETVEDLKELGREYDD